MDDEYMDVELDESSTEPEQDAETFYWALKHALERLPIDGPVQLI